MLKVIASLAMVSLSMVAPGASFAASQGKVLVVLSSEHQLQLKDGKTYETGYFLNEVVIPLRKLVEAGFEPVYANPRGNKPAMDPNSNNKLFFGGDEEKRAAALEFLAKQTAFGTPQTLASIAKGGTGGFIGVFIPGGHAPMADLASDKALGELLRSFHAAGKPTGIICHGPIALLSALPEATKFREALAAGDYQSLSNAARGWPYAGYRMTVFTTAEEQAVEGPNSQLGGYVPFYAETALTEAGGRVETLGMWKPNVVEDRELLTAQQPHSDEAFGTALVTKLKAAVSK
jgi:putative intracellular protease/amidase